LGRNAVGIYLKTINLLFLAFQAPPPYPYRCHPVAHFPSCPLSIPEISSPPPPCPHLCWLSHCPCCRAANSSHSLDAPPLPCDALLPVVHFYTATILLCPLTLHHFLSHCCLTCASSTPRLHLHRLVVTLHLVALPLPPVLSSTLLPVDAPLPHVALATPPPIYLLFTPAGCHVASCGTPPSHPLACPPLCLRLHLLLHLVLICPG
jgi:hypothetical protein